MKTIRNNKTVELLVENAKGHMILSEIDLDFLDMAIEEINVAFRMASPKDDYTIADVLNEIYEVTGYDKIANNSRATEYLNALRTFKHEFRQRK